MKGRSESIGSSTSETKDVTTAVKAAASLSDGKECQSVFGRKRTRTEDMRRKIGDQ